MISDVRIDGIVVVAAVNLASTPITGRRYSCSTYFITGG